MPSTATYHFNLRQPALPAAGHPPPEPVPFTRQPATPGTQCQRCHQGHNQQHYPLYSCAACNSNYHPACIDELRSREFYHGRQRLMYGCPNCGTAWIPPAEIQQQHAAEWAHAQRTGGDGGRYQYRRAVGGYYVCTMGAARGALPCGWAGRGWSNLTEHHRVRHERRGVAYRCHTCQRSFSDGLRLLRHREGAHPRVRPPYCPVCAVEEEIVGLEDMVRHVEDAHAGGLDVPVCLLCFQWCGDWLGLVLHAEEEHEVLE
ncbi:uncharacterized protein BO97DRAFT_422793 [Aspergillus homomorphus CBS 101889]|uniref:C2H2-type domain-containing protein n=1 Tax=Aspergillus homomorphus (strain CBS 101889) TaxID=1450537 RepID=A0A395I3S3_ASPHC|nr:hypothetical protein BO97DRAFT_422793 [Aspergillus homomorphus CBS 101889]RAL14376.1 hypothetical protein BO97DRAFT_422793 [Aspergillus homomorphus CBS 101889]